MEILNYFEEKLKSSVDVEQLKNRTLECFRYNLKDNDENEVQEMLTNTLEGDDYLCQFSEITVHLLHSNSRKPFLRVKYDIINERNRMTVAWYEVEFGVSGEILDDYFDLI